MPFSLGGSAGVGNLVVASAPSASVFLFGVGPALEDTERSRLRVLILWWRGEGVSSGCRD